MSSNNPVRGDIYWANLKPAQGSEQNGSRPVLIVSNNLMNETSTVVIIAPMSTAAEKAKAGPFNIPYLDKDVVHDEEGIKKLSELGQGYVRTDGLILCNQSRAIGKHRLLGRIGKLNNVNTIINVNGALIHTFCLDGCDVCDIPLRPGAVMCIRCHKVFKKKCVKCHGLHPITFNFCPTCGEGGLPE